MSSPEEAVAPAAAAAAADVLAECTQRLQDVESAVANVRSCLEQFSVDEPSAVSLGLLRSPLSQEPSSLGGRSGLAFKLNGAPSPTQFKLNGAPSPTQFELQDRHEQARWPPSSPTPVFDTAILRSLSTQDLFPSPRHQRGSAEKSNVAEPRSITLMSRLPTGQYTWEPEGQVAGHHVLQENHTFHLRKRFAGGSEMWDVALVKQSAKAWFPMPIVHPEARFAFVWLALGWGFIVYESFSAPVFWAFDVEVFDGPLFGIASVINMYFILDIVMMFLTAFHDERGVLVLSISQIARRYRRGWLCFDVIAAVPWEWIPASVFDSGDARNTSKGLRAARVVRLLRCLRALRFTKWSSFANRMESYTSSSNERFQRYFSLVQHIGGLIICVHWLACIWYWIGIHGAVDDRSWVNKLLVEARDYDAFGLYLFSAYFIFETMTTVGFGDITPTNLSEVVFTIALLSLSCPVLGYLTGRVVELTMSFSTHSRQMHEKQAILQKYLSWRAVPKQLGGIIKQHLKFAWTSNGGNDEIENTIKQQLSPMLRLELMYHIYGKHLEVAPFLSWMRGYGLCVKELSTDVISRSFSKGDFLFRTGEPNEVVHVLTLGNVWVTQNASMNSMNPGDEANRRHGARRRTERERRTKMLLHRSLKLWHHPNEAAPQGSPFYSRVLHHAGMKVAQEELRLTRAAKMVQKRWRERRAGKTTSKEPTDSAESRDYHGGRQRYINSSALSSIEVPAPAYFGESCLWAPRPTWNQPGPLYPYGTICRTRAEVLAVPRRAVGDVIDKYSPWLGERFDVFREAVIAGLGECLLVGEQESPQATLPPHSKDYNLDGSAEDYNLDASEASLPQLDVNGQSPPTR